MSFMDSIFECQWKKLTATRRWTYLPTGAPEYHKGHSVFLGLMLFCFVIALLGTAHCYYENRLRARGGRDHRLEGLTSKEAREKLGHRHPEFRYMM